MDTACEDIPRYEEQPGWIDSYLQECPARAVMETLASKWTMVVIRLLSTGPMRFNELHRRLERRITHKVLTQTLRALERDGMISRTVEPTIPPRVDYELTELGLGAWRMLGTVGEWSKTAAPEMKAARAAYEEAAVPLEATR